MSIKENVKKMVLLSSPTQDSSPAKPPADWIWAHLFPVKLSPSQSESL